MYTKKKYIYIYIYTHVRSPSGLPWIGLPVQQFPRSLFISPSQDFEGKKAGIVRACADDIGVALRALRFLKLLFPIFQSAQSIAGLNLKPSKCNIIVLVQLSDDLYNQIKGWLAVNLPSWVSFQVCSTAKYLGFFLGPEAGAHNWAGPLRKFRDRVAAIRASDAPVSIAVYTYNIRAVPVTSYVSQLIPLPKEAAALERTSMHTVLRLPQQTFHHSDFFNLSEFGIKDLRSLTVACKSALFRCAACTVTHWPHWKTQLQTTAAETLPLSHLHDGSLSPPFWDSPPSP